MWLDFLISMSSEPKASVVMKRKGSIYRPGFRSPDWIKVPIHREEFVV